MRFQLIHFTPLLVRDPHSFHFNLSQVIVKAALGLGMRQFTACLPL